MSSRGSKVLCWRRAATTFFWCAALWALVVWCWREGDDFQGRSLSNQWRLHHIHWVKSEFWPFLSDFESLWKRIFRLFLEALFFGFPFKTRWMAWVLWYVLLYPTICIVHLRLSKRTLLGLIVPFFKSDTCSSHYKRRDHDHHPRDYFCVTFWMTQHGNVSFSFRWIMDGRLLLITSLLPQRGLQSFLHNMYHLGSKYFFLTESKIPTVW